MSHTPGPWIVTNDVGAHVIRGADVAHTTESGLQFTHRNYVASIWGGYHEADARLIAAAPDLLEALQALHARYRKAIGVQHWGAADAEADLMAQAAIAKATGADHD